MMITDRESSCGMDYCLGRKLTLVAVAVVTLFLLPLVAASHQIEVEVSPAYMANNASKTLNLRVENRNASADSIWHVKIVKNGNYEAQCLKAEGWSLASQPGYCTYTTTDKIQPGEATTFKLELRSPSQPGDYNWDIYTTDSASPNQGSSATVATRVDAEPPLTNISPDGEFTSGPKAQFTLNCADSQADIQSGCFRTFYRVTDKEQCSALNYTQGTSGSISCSGQVCRRRVCYYSIDRAGNWEKERTSSVFIIDAARPNIVQASVSPQFKINETSYVRGTVTLSARVRDEGAGLSSVNFRLQGEGVSQDCPGSRQQNRTWSCSLDTLQLPDGTYTLFIDAEDKVGNQNSKEIYSFHVSNKKPIIRLIESASIRFTYSQSKLSGIKEESLQLYHYDRETGSWEEVDGELNTEQNYVEMPLSNLSQFTLFGEMEGAIEVNETNETEQCQPNWSCTAWSDCTNGTRTRNCTDSNECGTEQGKPQTVKSCVDTCQPDWECTNWSECTNGTRARNCTDLEQCGVDEDKPVEIKGCEGCQKNWVCTDWSKIECTNGTKTRECVEWNNCAGEDELPTKNETIKCGQEQPKPGEVSEGISARRKLGIAVLVILIVIIALVLYYR